MLGKMLDDLRDKYIDNWKEEDDNTHSRQTDKTPADVPKGPGKVSKTEQQNDHQVHPLIDGILTR